MKKYITILSVVLVAQLLLAAVINLTGEDYGTFKAEELLLTFDKQTVNGIRIEDGTDSVVINQQGEQWLLSEQGNFPVNSRRVEQLLDSLADLKRGWPVAKTASSAQRFNVAEKQFGQKLTLLSGEHIDATLFIGSSPGFRKVYVRQEHEDDVFAVEFDTWTAATKIDDWVDKEILLLKEGDVERVELLDVTLQRQGGEWVVSDLTEEEQTNLEATRSLVTKLAGLRIQSLLGTINEPNYQQDKPALDVKIWIGDKALSYRFSKSVDANYFVLKRSDLDYYFKVTESAVNVIKESTRDVLVQIN